jgi:tetratricopeptide (TPR) repeat protein
MIKTGFAFHVHHDRLVEFCTDYDGRVAYIKSHKPEGEQELRLRLFKLIPKNKLPLQLVKAMETYAEARETCDEAMETYAEARETCDEARETYDEAWKTYDEAWKTYAEARETCDEAWETYDEAGKTYAEAGKTYAEARETCDEAEKTYDEAWKTYAEARETCEAELIKLHAELCPDCPWDGKTIFKSKPRLSRRKCVKSSQPMNNTGPQKQRRLLTVSPT